MLRRLAYSADEYSIEETDALNIGTKVEIELKPGDASEFAKPQRVIDVINKVVFCTILMLTMVEETEKREGWGITEDPESPSRF